MNRGIVTLPAEVPLTGADYLLLAFDRAMQRGTQHGNVCHLVLELDGHLEVAELRTLLDAHPYVGWLAGLRFVPLTWWIPARWRTDPTAPTVQIDEHTIDNLDALPSLFSHSLDVATEAPVGFLLVHTPTHSALVLRWHHAMLDGRGAELLIRALSFGTTDQQTVTAPEVAPTRPLRERLWQAKAARDFVWAQSTGSVSFLSPARASKGAQLRFRRLVLTPEQTAAADERGGHVLMRSAWNLAITAASISDARPNASGDNLLVPVPQDRRARGAVGPILANQLNLLFYKIPRATLSDTAEAVRGLTEQTRTIMRARLHQNYPVLLDLCRYVPLWILNIIIRVPTWGTWPPSASPTPETPSPTSTPWPASGSRS